MESNLENFDHVHSGVLDERNGRQEKLRLQGADLLAGDEVTDNTD